MLFSGGDRAYVLPFPVVTFEGVVMVVVSFFFWYFGNRDGGGF